jgi:hypothetical protein
VPAACGSDENLEVMHGIVYEIGVRGQARVERCLPLVLGVATYYAAIGDEILSVDDLGSPARVSPPTSTQDSHTHPLPRMPPFSTPSAPRSGYFDTRVRF